MRTLVLLFVTLAFVAPCAQARAGEPAGGAKHAQTKSHKATPRKRLRAFRSERELKKFLRKLARVEVKREVLGAAPPVAKSLAEAADEAPAASATRSAGTAAKADTSAQGADSEESVTNVQHAGVDEGGIVKLHGNHLVVLRRGRLFTIDISGGALRPVSALDAFGPDIEDAEEAWYDELLVSNDTVVVIGYSYERGGTEVGLFRIDRAGRLSYRATYQLRSDDYYSERNYASRLVGNKLIFYAPLNLLNDSGSPLGNFPALRRWHKGAEGEEGFRRIIPATRVYRAGESLDEASEPVLHTVRVCDLAGGDMSCAATALVGVAGGVFYVSPAAVYVWADDWAGDEADARPRSVVYRMPLDGSGPSALRVSGTPNDQFAFLESEDGYLNVLVGGYPDGAAMWNDAEMSGALALLRVPVWSFSDGGDAAPASSYRDIPAPNAFGNELFHNRFVGDYLLYGSAGDIDGQGRDERAPLYAVRWAGGEVVSVPLEHGVDRIEALGPDAIVVGAGEHDLHFTSVRLADGAPRVAGRYTRKGAAQSEERSHGFFYKPEGPDSGLLGLPISTPVQPGHEDLFEESAAVLFLRNESLNLKELGELAAHPETAVDDDCRASCVDWYGNARPLFFRGRVFALLGYELVEGALQDGRFTETRRVTYAPRPAPDPDAAR